MRSYLCLHVQKPGFLFVNCIKGEPSGEAFVRFISEQAVQMVMASKQGQSIINAATGVQTKVQLSRATSAEIMDFVSYPVAQPTLNWNNTAGFGAHVNSYHLLPGSAALHAPLLMQLRGFAPFTAPEVLTSVQKTGFTLTTPQTASTINVGMDILYQSEIRAGVAYFINRAMCNRDAHLAHYYTKHMHVKLKMN